MHVATSAIQYVKLVSCFPMALSKLKKGLLITAAVIVAIIALVIIFISPITKYLIEKYDEKFTGRQIELDWAYVNPFTGTVHFNDLKIYEFKSDSIFASFGGLGVNLNMLKLLSKEYEVESVSIDEPYVKIIQNKKEFNFDDIIQKFASDDTVQKQVEKLDTTKYRVLDIEIADGTFHFIEGGTPVNYAIKKFNFDSEGLYYDRDTVAGNFDFQSAMGTGDVKGDFTFNLKSQAFRVATKINKFDLKIIEQYVKDIANYGKLEATLDADMRVIGNLNDGENVNVKGFAAVNDFHFGVKEGEDYTSFKQAAININDLSPKNKVYDIDSIMVLEPFFRYEKYDSLDNVQRMFGKGGSNVKAAEAQKEEQFNLVLAIADYAKVLSKNFLHSYYKVNKFAVYRANIEYQDYSLREKFRIKLDPLTIVSDSIDKNNRRFNVDVTSGLKPYGDVKIELSMNPQTEGDFDLNYDFTKIPISMFNPYLTTFTSFPFDRGTVEVKGNWAVRNEKINSKNNILIIDPRPTKKIKNPDTKWIPMPLIMAFIRERGNVIDYNVPITGSLKDPKFHFRDIIFDVLKNIFVKPATTGYRFEVKDIEQQVEKSLNLKWKMRQSDLLTKEDDFVHTIANFLAETPEASIVVQPVQYEEKEKELIMFYEAKKKFYLARKNKKSSDMTAEDSTKIEEMSVKEGPFVAYLNKQVKDSMLFTVQKKCYEWIGDKAIQEGYDNLRKRRAAAFLKYFTENGTANRVTMKKDDTGIPYNGFSFYQISYKGEIPEYLREAYEDLETLNEKNPRKKYTKERKKILGIF